MAAFVNQPAADIAGTDLRSLGRELRDFLLRERRSADEEIRSYPTPIPRCDAQFNAVYAQRSQLSDWLHRLDAALEQDAPVALAAMMSEFCRAPRVGATVEEPALRDRVAAALSGR